MPVERTPERILPTQAPVSALLSASLLSMSRSVQLLMFSTSKLMPLKVFSWKS
jgi:hypothetical protein